MSGGVDEGATWSETWSERVQRVMNDGRGHARVAHDERQDESAEQVAGAGDGTREGGAAKVGTAGGSVRVLQAASVGMFWLRHDTPAACVAPGLELEEDIHQQQQVQLDGEQDADGNDLRQKPAAAECRPTHSMRTVSSTAEQRCTHADAGAQDARAGGQERWERACGAAGGAHKSTIEESSRIDQPPSSTSQSENLVPAFDPQQQQQGNRESSSTGSTFATRGEGGGAERRERMGVTARIGVAMGEARGGARMWVEQLGERMKRLGDGAKRWLWRDAG